MDATIRAVIFDFGGVITSSPFEAFNRLEAERGLPRDFIRTINATDPDHNAWARMERSEIDVATFDQLFAEEAARAGYRLEGSAVLEVIAGDIRPEMVATLDRLVAEGLRIGCITNNMRGNRGPGMARSERAANDYAAVFARFEQVIESAEAGVRKPDPRIFAMMCERLGVEPGECVFLDDIGVNCKGAASIGIHAIKVTGARQALTELGAVLGLDLAAATIG